MYQILAVLERIRPIVRFLTIGHFFCIFLYDLLLQIGIKFVAMIFGHKISYKIKTKKVRNIELFYGRDEWT